MPWRQLPALLCFLSLCGTRAGVDDKSDRNNAQASCDGDCFEVSLLQASRSDTILNEAVSLSDGEGNASGSAMLLSPWVLTWVDDENETEENVTRVEVAKDNDTEQNDTSVLSTITEIGDRIARELEYELNMDASASGVPHKNKLVLALIEVLFLGCCGFDRIFLGQTVVGIIKFLTLGGLGVWAIVDYCIIIPNCLLKKDNIDTLWLQARFYKSTIQPAYSLVLAELAVGLMILVFRCVYKSRRRGSGAASPQQPLAEDRMDAEGEGRNEWSNTKFIGVGLLVAISVFAIVVGAVVEPWGSCSEPWNRWFLIAGIAGLLLGFTMAAAMTCTTFCGSLFCIGWSVYGLLITWSEPGCLGLHAEFYAYVVLFIASLVLFAAGSVSK